MKKFSSKQNLPFPIKEYRNDWYNEDFFDLIAKRWDLSKNNKILDVGCGLFHWSRNFTKYFSNHSSIIGIDLNRLNKKNKVKIQKSDDFKTINLEYIQADAERLPFKNETFDLVSCQTLLIHLNDPLIALMEMKRVLKFGGRIICVEPNNSMQTLVKDSINYMNNIRKKIMKEKDFELGAQDFTGRRH